MPFESWIFGSMSRALPKLLSPFCRSLTPGLHAARVNPGPEGMLPHGLRTGLRQLHVVRALAARVAVPLDTNGHRRPRPQDLGDLVEQREAARLNRGLVRVEEDLLFQL